MDRGSILKTDVTGKMNESYLNDFLFIRLTSLRLIGGMENSKFRLLHDYLCETDRLEDFLQPPAHWPRWVYLARVLLLCNVLDRLLIQWLVEFLYCFTATMESPSRVMERDGQKFISS